ncbi:AAA family ATPase, partial [Rhizobium johnstonii]|uniref:AAA family ATPase n=1 Tax=Rhizobium johnstonii TaxID=3019933 RepID=UPI003F9B6748
AIAEQDRSIQAGNPSPGQGLSAEQRRAIEHAGAKLVLVGDHEQLQAIGAGAPFRAIAEAVGHAQLSEVRRQ